MSEAPEQAYISKIHLKGYKSIRDLEIDFKPGLNIIIGPNGSGKTNFLEFLKSILKREIISNENILSEIDFNSLYIPSNFNDDVSIKNYRWTLSIKSAFSKSKITERIFEEKILADGEMIAFKSYSYPYENKTIPINHENSIFLIFRPTVIYYNIPQEIVNNISQIGFVKHDIDTNTTEFLFFEKIFEKELLFELSFSTHENLDISKNDVLNLLKIKKSLLINLAKFSPIKNFRLSKSLSVDIDKNKILINFIAFEFFINNEWLSWNQLSDGTKRLFYTISSISNSQPTVLIEEPELGIHPDQLHKLMDFLIEQSKEKQIIITTHSPEVLNAIHPDELDRIIVTRYDAEKGTVMRKLSPEQAKEMGDRIKEGDMFLSDRWVHLNLEDEIFNAAQLNEK